MEKSRFTRLVCNDARRSLQTLVGVYPASVRYAKTECGTGCIVVRFDDGRSSYGVLPYFSILAAARIGEEDAVTLAGAAADSAILNMLWRESDRGKEWAARMDQLLAKLASKSDGSKA